MVIKINIIDQFQKIISYYDILIKENIELDYLKKGIKEQNENIDDLIQRIKKFENTVDEIGIAESLEDDDTINKLVNIHSFLVDVDWHVSELYDLNKELVKLCSEKREI